MEVLVTKHFYFEQPENALFVHFKPISSLLGWSHSGTWKRLMGLIYKPRHDPSIIFLLLTIQFLLSKSCLSLLLWCFDVQKKESLSLNY